jgi:nitroreductase/dihydropteridine reductase
MSNIIEALNWRYATKEFDPSKKISDADLNTLVESLRLSPSSFGLQPWKFVLVEDKEKREALLPKSWNQKQVVDASHLFVLCRYEKFTDEDVDRFIKDTATKRSQDIAEVEGYAKMIKGFVGGQDEATHIQWMNLQVYIALGFLMETAALMNIDACPMEGFSKPDYDEILDLPSKGLRSTVVCPVGYRADSDKYATLAKIRYDQNDVILKI